MDEAGYGEDVPMLHYLCRNFSRQSQDAGSYSHRHWPSTNSPWVAVGIMFSPNARCRTWSNYICFSWAYKPVCARVGFIHHWMVTVTWEGQNHSVRRATARLTPSHTYRGVIEMSFKHEKETTIVFGIDTFQIAQALLLFALTLNSDLPWWKWVLFILNYAGLDFSVSKKVKSTRTKD